MYNKTNPAPYHATLQIKVKDTLKAATASKLLGTSVTFIGATRRCQPWTVSPTARQCSTCLKWGHTAYVCRARSPQCDQCASQHLTAHHAHHTSTCKDQRCAHYDIKCVNCDDQHHASSMSCPFFKARSSPGQLQKLQKTRVEQIKVQQQPSRIVDVEFDGGRGKETRRREAGIRPPPWKSSQRSHLHNSPPNSNRTAGVGPNTGPGRSLAPPPSWLKFLVVSPSAQPCTRPPYPVTFICGFRRPFQILYMYFFFLTKAR